MRDGLTWVEPDKGNFENYTRVRLLTDRFQEDGANLFDVGYIIEVYSGGKYEVEFFGAGGITTAQITVSEQDIQSAEGDKTPTT